MPPSTPGDAHLYFRMVRCHTKAHQAKGHKLLLVDVYVGPGVVLETNTAGGFKEEAGPPQGHPSPRQSKKTQLKWPRRLALPIHEQKEGSQCSFCPDKGSRGTEQQEKLRSDLRDFQQRM